MDSYEGMIHNNKNIITKIKLFIEYDLSFINFEGITILSFVNNFFVIEEIEFISLIMSILAMVISVGFFLEF